MITHLQKFVDELGTITYPDWFLLHEAQGSVPLVGHLNDSILAGEYYNLPGDGGDSVPDDDYDKELKALFDKAIDVLNRLRNEQVSAPRNERAEAAYKLINRSTREVIAQYREFVDRLRENRRRFFQRGDLPTKPRYLVQPVDVLRMQSEPSRIVNQEVGELLGLFSVTLHLAELDENLICSDGLVRRLGRYEAWLNDVEVTNPNPTVRLLKSKVKYLRKKIEIREEFADRKERRTATAITPEGPEKTELTDKSEFDGFAPFYDETVAHYGHAGLETFGTEANPTSRQLHEWSRYLRRQARRSGHPPDWYGERRQEVQTQLTRLRLLNKVGGRFDQFAYNSLINLLFNTLVILTLREEEAQNYSRLIEGIRFPKPNSFFENLLRDVASHQDAKTGVGVYDYYPYERVLRFLNRFRVWVRGNGLEFVGRKQEALVDDVYQTLRQHFEELRKLYIRVYVPFNFGLRWCRQRSYSPVYLTAPFCYGKATVQNAGQATGAPGPVPSAPPENRRLFLASSYVLPDDHRRVEQRWSLAERTYTTELQLTEDFLKVEFGRMLTEKTVETRKEEFEKKVKENEFKQVQIVAMFVSVAAFVLANVKIFENRSLYGSLAILLAMASCLVLFNAFFKWLIDDRFVDPERAKPRTDFDWRMTALIVVMAGLSLVFAFLAESKGQDRLGQMEHRNTTQSDSLRTLWQRVR